MFGITKLFWSKNISLFELEGAFSLWSCEKILPFDVAPTINPPPPKLPFSGEVTASAKPTATAASTALPPFSSILTPALEAFLLSETTIPFSAYIGSGEAVLATIKKSGKRQKYLYIFEEIY